MSKMAFGDRGGESRDSPPEGSLGSGWVEKEEEEDVEEEEVFTSRARHDANTLIYMQPHDLETQNRPIREDLIQVGVSKPNTAQATGGIPWKTRGGSVQEDYSSAISNRTGRSSLEPSDHRSGSDRIKYVWEGRNQFLLSRNQFLASGSTGDGNISSKAIGNVGCMPPPHESDTCDQVGEESALKGQNSVQGASGAFRQSGYASSGERTAIDHDKLVGRSIHRPWRDNTNLRGDLIIEDLELCELQDSNDNVFEGDSVISPSKSNSGLLNNAQSDLHSNGNLKSEGLENNRGFNFKALNFVPEDNIEEVKYSRQSPGTVCQVCQGVVQNDPQLREPRNYSSPYASAIGYGLISRIDPSVEEQALAWRSAMFSRYRSSSMPEHTFRKRDLGLIKASLEESDISQKGLNDGEEEWVTSTDNRGHSDAGPMVEAAGGVGSQEMNLSQSSDLGSVGNYPQHPSQRHSIPSIGGGGDGGDGGGGEGETIVQIHRRRSADSSLPTVLVRGNKHGTLPSLPVTPCRCLTEEGGSLTSILSLGSNPEMGFQPSFSPGHYPRRRDLGRLSPIVGMRKRPTFGSSEFLSPSAEESGFRPISPSSTTNSGVDSLPLPNQRFARTPSPTLTARSLSPVPYLRQRANTFSGSGLLSNDRSLFLSPPRSPARLPRDPIQPSQGSISDLSDKFSQEEAGEETDSFSFRPLQRQRSRTCPENRAWRRRKMAASNRPPTPPPLGTGSSPRGSNIDLANRRLAGLTLSPGMARRGDQLPDLPQLLEDQDQDLELSDGEKTRINHPGKTCGNGILPVLEIKTKDLKNITKENILDTDLRKVNQLGAVR